MCFVYADGHNEARQRSQRSDTPDRGCDPERVGDDAGKDCTDRETDVTPGAGRRPQRTRASEDALRLRSRREASDRPLRYPFRARARPAPTARSRMWPRSSRSLCSAVVGRVCPDSCGPGAARHHVLPCLVVDRREGVEDVGYRGRVTRVTVEFAALVRYGFPDGLEVQ